MIEAEPGLSRRRLGFGVQPGYKLTWRRVVRSEWHKLWSLRSTWITLLVSTVVLIGFGLIAAWDYESSSGSGGETNGPVEDSSGLSLPLFGVNFAQLALGVLGVLVTAGEYSTGLIRSTLTAVPKRLPVLWAKALVFGVVAMALATMGVFATFVLDMGILSGTDAELALGDDGVTRGLLGAGLYLALIGMIAVGLGALLRSVAGAIALLVFVLLLLPSLLALLPKAMRDNVVPYLPSSAGDSMYALTHEAPDLSPHGGLMTLIAWTVLALGAAAYRLTRSDA